MSLLSMEAIRLLKASSPLFLATYPNLLHWILGYMIKLTQFKGLLGVIRDVQIYNTRKNT